MREVALSMILALTCLACNKDLMCTAIGAEPGVGFNLAGVLTQDPVDVKVCVESTCVHRRASLGRWRTIFVQDQTLTGPTVVPVTVTIKRRGSDSTILEDTTTVQLHQAQPNGPDCPPMVYQGAVDVRADGIHELSDGSSSP
jgi:hypothetical protein